MKPAQPPRIAHARLRCLIEAWQRQIPNAAPPLIHADDALALLEGDDADVAAATALFEEHRIFYPPNHEITWRS